MKHRWSISGDWASSRLRRKARSKRCRLFLRPPSALAQGRLSRRAREGAHPQLFGRMLKDKPAFYVPVKMADPSLLHSGPVLCAVIYAQDLQILILNAVDNDVRQAS